MIGTVVGVLRGGPSREHEVSLQSGHTILSNLSPDRFTTRDVYIDKRGVWHVHGRETTPSRALHSVDVVVMGLHGENRDIHNMLARHGVAYTGSDPFAAYLATHRVLAKERAKEHGVRTPRYHFVESEAAMDQVLAEVVRTFTQPVVVKPVKSVSKTDVSFIGGYAPLHSVVSKLLHDDVGGVLIEELVKGTVASVSVVEGLRGEELYALPVVEVGEVHEFCPGHFSKEVTEELQQLARTMHQALGLRHYSRSDFIVSPLGTYFLKTNALPEMTTDAHLTQSLASVGVSMPDFLGHVIDLAQRS